METVVFYVEEFGFPVVAMVGLGYFVYYVWQTMTNVIGPAIKQMHFALTVMQQRQKDNNLIEAMELYDKKIVMSAYSQPQQRTIRLRIEAAKNFANLNAQKCFKWSIL